MNRARVDALFAHAIDLREDERADWLARECADDAERAHVERLLRADASAGDFLEQPPALVAAAVSGVVQERGSPTVFGAYRVVRSIGVGGMGEVWLAERDDGEFQQRVAIKRLAYPTPGLLHRFRQERQILARLEHAHIARLIDGGLDAGGMPYLAMEYVDGVPITRHVADAVLDLKALLELFLRVCDAVQYAHQNLVVHRDLKPSNIFVTADGTPKLLDFGIAKVLSADTTDAPTQTVARLLTPDYAAPEQFDGGAITTATDVYALGVVLYELLTGRHPYRHARGGANAGDVPDPLPPSAASRDRRAARTTGRVPRGDLDRIVLVAIARDASRRYASAEAFATDIRRYLDGRPVSANPGSLGYRLRKFAARNRYPLGAALVVVAACVAATAVGWRQMQRANEQASRAQAARQFLAGVFEQAGPNRSQGKPMTAHELLERGEQQLGRFGGEPAIEADLTGLIAGLYWDIGDAERALALLKQADAAIDDPRVPDEIKARNLVRRAMIERRNKNNDVAVVHARQALDRAERAGAVAVRERSDARRAIMLATEGAAGVDYMAVARDAQALLAEDEARFGARSDMVAKDLGLLAVALLNAGQYRAGVDASRRALEIDGALYGERSAAVSDDLFYIGMGLLQMADFAGAEAALEHCAAVRTDVYGADNIETIDARTFVLLVEELLGRYAEVLPKRLQLLEDQRRFRDSNPGMLADAYNMLGDSYVILGRFAEAENAQRESLAIRAGKDGTNDSIASRRALSSLSDALQLEGRYSEAEAARRKTLALAVSAYPAGGDVPNAERGELGNILRLQHRHAEALDELRQAATALDGGSKVHASMVQAQLAEAELDAGHPDLAFAAATRGLELGRASMPRGQRRLAYPLFALARAELAREHPAEAEPLLREALAVRSPPYPAYDPRVLEVKVALVDALTGLGRQAQAQALRAEIEPLLKASATPYAKDLLERLGARR